MIKSEIAIGMNGSMLDEHPTGTGVYSFNLINHLCRLQKGKSWQQITVFTPTSSLLNKNLRIIKLPGVLLSSKYGKLAAFCRFFWNTFYYPFQARNFDLLISPTTHGSFVLKNQIITIHDLISLRYDNISAHQRFYFKYLLPFLVSRAKLVIAVSEATKKDIIKFLKCPEEKVKVIYNGFDHKHYNLVQDNIYQIYNQYGFINYLLAVGPTYPHKNFEILIHAYCEFDDAFKACHPLVIAGGKKAYLDQLKQLVADLNQQNYIHFTGYVPFELMPSLYREATALVFPSLYEGFGFPLLEAMACGCPVIVSNTSSMPEVCGDAVWYIDPLDKNDLKESIKRVMSDKELQKELRKKGIAQAKKFSWEQTAESFKTLIETHFNHLI